MNKRIKKDIIKFICVTLFSLGVIGLIGCGSSTNNSESLNTNNASSSDNKKNNTQPNSDNQQNNTQTNEKPATIPNQLPYKMEVLQPDSIGTVYGNLTYTNNGEYPVTYFQLIIQYTDKDGNSGAKAYFTNYDTVMPGETSPVIKTFCNSDWKALTLEYKIYDKETQKSRRLQYDYKLEELRGSNWN